MPLEDKRLTVWTSQVVVAMLDPLQEGGLVTAAAVGVLEQLVINSRDLLKDNMKSLPPLPQSVDKLGTYNFANICAETDGLIVSCCAHVAVVTVLSIQQLNGWPDSTSCNTVLTANSQRLAWCAAQLATAFVVFST